jgi:hypothetical protein
MSEPNLHLNQIRATVESVLASQQVVDMHTHTFPPCFGTPVTNATGRTDPQGLMLWGLDELLTYHYLIAEVYRVVPPSRLPYEQFWRMTRAEQADHIWKHLFVERSPISEACRGVITALVRLGLDPDVTSLASLRRYFAELEPDRFVDRVMELAGVERILMTNSVFDDNERQRWFAGQWAHDPRFAPVLRIDPVVLDWPASAAKLSAWGYEVSREWNERTQAETRRFLRDWITRMAPVYLAVSLPPTFRYPASSEEPSLSGEHVLRHAILPVCAELGLPFAMMIGAIRGANPALRDAGDMGGEADVQSVVHLCRDFPENRFLVTMLARENQHELIVAARKFSNLMIFGCWWFLNNPSLMEEITRMRLELLGTSFIPQHSDARILDQLLYKWEHSRRVIAQVLAGKYEALGAAGWPIRRTAIERDVRLWLRDNFLNFVGRR